MSWHDKVDEKYSIYGRKWKIIATELSKEFNCQIDADNVRSYWRYNHKEKQTKPVEKDVDLLKILDKPHTLAELVDKTKLSQRIILAQIEDYKEAGYNITVVNDTYCLAKHVVPHENIHTVDWKGNRIIKFGVVSDTHLGSKWQQLTFLKDLYKTFKQESVEKVFHVGDLTDGFYKNRQNHIYELIDGLAGATAQANYVVNNYPDDVETWYILGNHDETHITNGGFDISEIISLKRPDMKFLGYSNATVNIAPNTTVELWHGKDGSSYANSYALQKYCDAMMSGQKPSILLSGHRHKSFQMFYRNVFCFESGTTQSLTPFMRDKKLAAYVGGWIIEVRVDEEGSIKGCKGEFLPLYVMRKDDY